MAAAVLDHARARAAADRHEHPRRPGAHRGIANVGIRGIAPGDLARLLMARYRIWTVAIDGAGVHGVRVTPQVYTSTAELDAFVKALTELAA